MEHKISQSCQLDKKEEAKDSCLPIDEMKTLQRPVNSLIPRKVRNVYSNSSQILSIFDPTKIITPSFTGKDLCKIVPKANKWDYFHEINRMVSKTSTENSYLKISKIMSAYNKEIDNFMGSIQAMPVAPTLDSLRDRHRYIMRRYCRKLRNSIQHLLRRMFGAIVVTHFQLKLVLERFVNEFIQFHNLDDTEDKFSLFFEFLSLVYYQHSCKILQKMKEQGTITSDKYDELERKILSAKNFDLEETLVAMSQNRCLQILVAHYRASISDDMLIKHPIVAAMFTKLVSIKNA